MCAFSSCFCIFSVSVKSYVISFGISCYAMPNTGSYLILSCFDPCFSFLFNIFRKNFSIQFLFICCIN
jgi:hypothetical protein